MAYGSGGFLCLVSFFCRCRTVFETIAVIAGFDDVAMVGQAVEQRGGHLGVVEDPGPFTEGEIGGEDHAGALVEFAHQMEQQCASSVNRLGIHIVGTNGLGCPRGSGKV